MRRVGLMAMVCCLLAAALPGADVARAETTGRLLVSLADPGANARAAAPVVLARAAARRAGPVVPEVGLLTVKPAAGQSLSALARRLRADASVRTVEVEHRATPRFVPDDPALSDPETAPGTPAGTTIQWWIPRTGLIEAWDVARGTNTTVAVIDSGADGGQPEIAPKVRDALDEDPTAGAGGALVDETGHGTHVSSLACAASGNGAGMAGAGLDCGLLVVKTDFSDSSVIKSIVDSTNRGVQVINMSFGTDGGRVPPTALVDAVNYAIDHNVVLVAAAADEATDEQGDPANILQPAGTGADANFNRGITVTAATYADQRASFAGYGSEISLAAYGAFAERGGGPKGIFGAWPANQTTFDRGRLPPDFSAPCRCRTTFRGDDRYAYLQGTSMATGIVSGVAALVRGLNPDLPATEVVRILKQTARRPAGTGWSNDLGWGIVDARGAVEAAKQIDLRPPTSVLRGPRTTRKRTITLRWSGQDTAPAGVAATGIDHYEIYRSKGSGGARRIAKTRKTTMRVRLAPKGRYAFYTIAVDRAGNREPKPVRPDARVRVAKNAR